MATYNIATFADLTTALGVVNPDDIIILNNGVNINVTSAINITRAGTSGHPIIMKAASYRNSTLTLASGTKFRANASFWTFQNFVIDGNFVAPPDEALFTIGQTNGGTKVTNIIITGLSLLHSGAAGLKINGSTLTGGSGPVTVTDLNIDGCGYVNENGEGLYIGSSSGYLLSGVSLSNITVNDTTEQIIDFKSNVTASIVGLTGTNQVPTSAHGVSSIRQRTGIHISAPATTSLTDIYLSNNDFGSYLINFDSGPGTISSITNLTVNNCTISQSNLVDFAGSTGTTAIWTNFRLTNINSSTIGTPPTGLAFSLTNSCGTTYPGSGNSTSCATPLTVTVNSVNDSTFSATWTTPTSVDTQTMFGTSTYYTGLTGKVPTPVTSHADSIFSLTPNTLYHFKAFSDGNSSVDRTIVSNLPAPTALTFGITIPTSVATASGIGNYSMVRPGDTVIIDGPTRGQLRLENFTGTAAQPITFINNASGVVTLDAGISGEAGLKIFGCHYIRVTGSGSVAQYGFKCINATLDGINTTSQVGSLGITDATDHIEIDHVEITQCLGGIQSGRNNPAEIAHAAWSGTGYHFHDLWIHDLTYPGESMYIGASTTIGTYPIHNVEIDHCLIERANYDGIQLRQTQTSCLVHHNYIDTTGLNPCKNGTIDNSSGFNIAHNCIVGDWYSNIIVNARKGAWISDVSNINIYNNLFIDSGHATSGLTGQCPTGVTSTPPEGTFIFTNTTNCRAYYNTIVNVTVPATYAIKIQSGNSGTTVVNSIFGGNYGVLTTGSAGGVTLTNNLSSTNISTIGFVDPNTDDYHLLASSAAVGTGTTPFPTYDLDGVLRQSPADRGCYELV